MIENHPDEEVPSGVMGLNVSEQKELIRNALAMLPKTDSLILMLFYFHEKGLDEIAEIIGMTPGNIKVKLFRIRKRLLLEMNNLLGNNMSTIA